ncbi:VirB4 family type IV secretion system protein [archaeon]
MSKIVIPKLSLPKIGKAAAKSKGAAAPPVASPPKVAPKETPKHVARQRLTPKPVAGMTKTTNATALDELALKVQKKFRKEKGVVETDDLLPYLIRPNSILNDVDKIKVNDTYNQMMMAVGWPRKVPPGFLDRVIKSKGNFDLAMYIEPFSIESMIVRLQRELEKQNADLQADMLRGKVNPSLENQIKDTRAALDNLMLGNERMFNIGLYLNAKATDDHSLLLLSRKLESDLNAINIIPKKPSFRMAQALQSMMPLCNDKLKVTRNIPTSALSACFPFTTSFLDIQETGVMMGINKDNNIPIIMDVYKKPFTNPNGLVLATSGAGKSYLIKLYIIRQILRGSKVIVIDPQSEYLDLTREYNGEIITISRKSKSMINPLDLMGQEYGDKLLSLETLFQIMLDPSETQKGILSKAVIATYKSKGIDKNDSKTWKKESPILGDLYKTLEKTAKKQKGEDKRDYTILLNRLHRYVDGVFSFLNRKTTIKLKKDLVTFNIRDMPDQVKPIAMFLVLEYVYKSMMEDKERKVLVVDEAWSLLQHASESSYVFKIVKTSRKFNLGLVIISQEVADLLGSKAGEAILANTSWTYLLRQKPAVIDAIVNAFKLNVAERNAIITAGLGEGILLAENEHIPIRIVASQKEHRLITTNPDEILMRKE